MTKNIYLLILLTINFISAQTKSNDYFSFYKGGEKYLKPIKYLMFDSSKDDNIKTTDNAQIYFKIKKEHFKYNPQKNKASTYSIDFLEKIKLEKPDDLENDAYKFFKAKKEEIERKNKIKLVYPPAGYQSFYKIFIIEKISTNKIVKYEVNWENSSF
ncbi:hypothetical protein HNP37_000039 [Flavobacterium nitrogenifigens]|uniref:Uncharacterized protein n=2 Tax=Flavobacterium TaxID=237 RepID=A0A7W7N4V2_9FLAO|nr:MULTISPECIES: hypothetical protein [Flavobacterium]MBB4800000.1 hypothetical protein [Flavobacterium nitrogenifigens]MBB6386250.1 hypothetical protein [Flavobacterium notoginsengisoli]